MQSTRSHTEKTRAALTTVVVALLLIWHAPAAARTMRVHTPEGVHAFPLEQVDSITFIGPPPGMKRIEGGTFQMGINTGHTHGSSPVHPVTVSSFWMDSTEVTKSEFNRVLGLAPSTSLAAIGGITWYDAVLYCNARSRELGFDTVYSYSSVTGTPGQGVTALGGLTIDFAVIGVRLPTDAEWEYACRGGTTTRYYWGDTWDPEYAWGMGVGCGHEVAQKRPNAFGLYDMLGNKREWVNDYWWDYTAAAQTDPTGPASGAYAIWRGGCGDDNLPYDALTCGSRFRDFRRDQSHYGLTLRTVVPIREE